MLSKYKKDLIIKESGEIKSFMEKNKKIPKTCNLGGVILSPYSVSYLMAKSIQDKFKSSDYGLANVIVYNDKMLSDTIDEKVDKSDYMMMVNNFISFCNKYRRVPRYITTQKSRIKVSFELFMYGLAKIIVFYQKNNYLPNYCNFTKGFKPNTATNTKTVKKEVKQSTSTNKNTKTFNSSPHPTKKGCGGMGQDTSYYCGVSALQKCLFKFGITDFSQKTLASWAGTTQAGTSHQGLATAVAMVNKKKGTKIKITEKNFSDIGWEGVGKILANPKQDIIFHNCYRLKYGHYEVCNQVNLTNNVEKVLNSLGDKCTSSCYCGYVESRSAAEFKKYMAAISQKSLIILTKA